jgi:hypothetical protein
VSVRPRAAPLLLAVCCACASEYPPPAADTGVRGLVSYGGTAGADYVAPGVQVAAFPTFPPSGPPFALDTVEDPVFDRGPVAYELLHLPARRYYVVAQFVDLRAEMDLSAPAGSHPDACALEASTGSIEVRAGEVTSGIDIVIHDGAGSSDPCHAAASVCPRPGKSSLVLEVSAALAPEDVTSDDQLVLGLFAAWPPTGPPVWFRLLTSGIVFPVQSIGNDLTPGQYAVYACLDRGKNHLTQVCGDEDSWVVHGAGALVDFPADRIVRIQLDLTAGTSTAPTVEDPAQHGCAGATARARDSR